MTAATLYSVRRLNRHRLFRQVQDTVNKDGENIEISIKGRHDPMIVPRAVVVVEAITALALVDLIFEI